MAIISEVVRKCICCCRRVHRNVTAPKVGCNFAVERESVVKVATSAPYDLDYTNEQQCFRGILFLRIESTFPRCDVFLLEIRWRFRVTDAEPSANF